MKPESRRLRDGDDLAGAILRSARHDAPSPEARRRVAGAIGASTLAAAAKAAGAAGAAGSKAASLASAVPISKLLVLVTVAAVATPITIRILRDQRPVPTAIATASSTKITAAHASALVPLPSPSVAALPPVPAPAPASADVPAVVSTPTEPVEHPSATQATTTRAAASGDPIARELAVLELAHAALGRGQTQSALAALDDYDRRNPSGALRQEADVLRIEALSRAGRSTEARALGNDFLARHPGSPYAKRIEASTNP